MSNRVPTSSSRLPNGWSSCKLGDLLFAIEAGKSFTCEPRPARPEEWGIIKVSAMTWGTFDEGENKAVPPSRPIDRRKEIEAGDILVSRSNTVSLVGASVLVGTCRPKLLLSDKSLRLRYSDRISARWLQGSLAAPHARDQLSAHATGTSDSMRNISQDDVLSLRLLLPPRNEQERIADALDEILSDLDAGVEALKRAQAKLKLYRASVLKAAVTGELTADWRAAHPEAESASDLLARILKERRRLWEAEQFRKYEAAGKRLPANWKSKYKEPVAPDTTKLPELPKGWCWACLDQLAWSSGYGTSVKCGAQIGGAAVLRIPNIVSGRIDTKALKFAPVGHVIEPEGFVQIGDLLIVRTNGSRTLIGRGAVLSSLASSFTFASYLIRIRLVPEIPLLSWISAIWDSMLVRTWIEERAATSAGQYNISLGVLSTLPVPLPPVSEIGSAVEILDEQLSVEVHVREDLKRKLESVAALRQTALRHAFTGQLLPQDPNDEPAHVLLERIAFERAERAASAARSKRSGPKSEAGSAARPRAGKQNKRLKLKAPVRDIPKQSGKQAAATA